MKTPCDDCKANDRCPKICTKYEKWFKAKWREIRKAAGVIDDKS